MRKVGPSRSGTLLILVAGLSAIIASTTLAFLLRMRSDGEESRLLLRQIQARAMLGAGLLYLQETARIGWDDPATAEKEETFGWKDIRDGGFGPRDQHGSVVRAKNGSQAFDPATGLGAAFPAVHRAARCPMQVMRRPPYALTLAPTQNPMIADPNLTWAQILHNSNPDPVAVATSLSEFESADRTPRFAQGSLGWFRVYRDDAATFTVTCGAGATQGYRNWDEVIADGQQAMFGDQAEFDRLRQEEELFWYRAEWNPTVGSNGTYHYAGSGTFRLNRTGGPHQGGIDDLPNARQFGGTFSYIQRLVDPPSDW